MVGFNKTVFTWKKKKKRVHTHRIYIIFRANVSFLHYLTQQLHVRYRISCGQQCHDLRGLTALQLFSNDDQNL